MKQNIPFTMLLMPFLER